MTLVAAAAGSDVLAVKPLFQFPGGEGAKPSAIGQRDDVGLVNIAVGEDFVAGLEVAGVGLGAGCHVEQHHQVKKY